MSLQATLSNTLEINMKQQTYLHNSHTALQVGQQATGKPLNIGTGFKALSFKHDQFDGLLDPLVMVDHFKMSCPTFGAHPHAGMSALSILFEDSDGIFNNRDSLGNNIDLLPGDAYWLKAGSGAVHDEKPTKGSRTHGLQIFVNLPQRNKQDAPASRHVSTHEIPVITGEGHKVRVVLGETNGTKGATSPAFPFTALDIFLENKGSYVHEVKSNNSLMVYAVSGEININLGNHSEHLSEKHAIAIQVRSSTQKLHLSSSHKAHLVILQGEPLHEQFIQKGPFVMSNTEEIHQVTAAYEAGLLGEIAE